MAINLWKMVERTNILCRFEQGFLCSSLSLSLSFSSINLFSLYDCYRTNMSNFTNGWIFSNNSARILNRLANCPNSWKSIYNSFSFVVMPTVSSRSRFGYLFFFLFPMIMMHQMSWLLVINSPLTLFFCFDNWIEMNYATSTITR